MKYSEKVTENIGTNKDWQQPISIPFDFRDRAIRKIMYKVGTVVLHPKLCKDTNQYYDPLDTV